jgi:NAD(P)H dehydrogenase (quinone)
MKITIVVASSTGRTRRMAEALADGARDAGAEVSLLDADTADHTAIADSDALVLGSGVHMAGISSAMRAFLERMAPQWISGAWAGKLGAAFVTAGAGARGGGELALISLVAGLAEHGMLIVTMSNRTKGFSSAGSHWGPVAWTNPRGGEAGPTEKHLEAARDHGRNIALAAARWRRGDEPA